MMKAALLLAMSALCVACGQRPAVIGITTNDLHLRKTRLGPSPADLAARVVDGRKDRREQLVGGPTPERLVRVSHGDTIEVRTAADERVAAVTMPFHITDFGATTSADGRPRLVVSMYPNARGSSTYAVFDANWHEVARWQEQPVTSRFATASWRGGPAIFYLQGNALVVRATDGRPVTRLPAPGGGVFRDVQVLSATDARLVLLASGNGYTPFHLVAVYQAGELVFHEIDDEHAFDLSWSETGFVVSTRSLRWEYSVPVV